MRACVPACLRAYAFKRERGKDGGRERGTEREREREKEREREREREAPGRGLKCVLVLFKWYDLKTGIQVVAPEDTWRYRVSAGNGRNGLCLK